MDSIIDLLMTQMDDDTVAQIGARIGADPQRTQQAVGAALPLLLGALGRNAADADGAGALARALESKHDGTILDDLVGSLARPEVRADGANILGHVLGGRQSVVESGLSRLAGLDQQSTSALLAMLAPAVLGALGKTQRENKLDVAGLAGLLQQERSATDARLGGLGQLLDMDGDGDVADDVLDMGTKLLGGFLGRRRG